jgi:predicted GNAT family acetyltransferase
MRHEFFADVEGYRPLLQYRCADRVMSIVHTKVPAPLRKRGIAAELVRAALALARAQGWRVDPACSYAREFMDRNAEYADLYASPAGDDKANGPVAGDQN